jgi:hypothetical protein
MRAQSEDLDLHLLLAALQAQAQSPVGLSAEELKVAVDGAGAEVRVSLRGRTARFAVQARKGRSGFRFDVLPDRRSFFLSVLLDNQAQYLVGEGDPQVSLTPLRVSLVEAFRALTPESKSQRAPSLPRVAGDFYDDEDYEDDDEDEDYRDVEDKGSKRRRKSRQG